MAPPGVGCHRASAVSTEDPSALLGALVQGVQAAETARAVVSCVGGVVEVGRQGVRGCVEGSAAGDRRKNGHGVCESSGRGALPQGDCRHCLRHGGGRGTDNVSHPINSFVHLLLRGSSKLEEM